MITRGTLLEIRKGLVANRQALRDRTVKLSGSIEAIDALLDMLAAQEAQPPLPEMGMEPTHE